MREHGPRLLFVAKAFSVLVIPVLVAAGMARVPFRRWFPIVLLGELVWVPALAVIAFQTTEVVRRVELGLHYLPLAGGAALLVLVLVGARRLKAGRVQVEGVSSEDNLAIGWRLPLSWPDAYVSLITRRLLRFCTITAVSQLEASADVVAPLRPGLATVRVCRTKGPPPRCCIYLGW